MYDFDRPRTARPDAAGTGVVAGSARLAPCDRHPRAPREGDVRIPAGCAIAAIMDRSGARHDGSDILRSIALMHDRGNGLGGGFAAYGIYPESRSCTPSTSCTSPTRPGVRPRPTWTPTL